MGQLINRHSLACLACQFKLNNEPILVLAFCLLVFGFCLLVFGF